MKYILGILFKYKFYKNPANIKIWLGETLIDDIDLEKDIVDKTIKPYSIKLSKDTSIYNYNNGSKENDMGVEMKLPNKIFTYVIEEKYLKDKKLKIIVKNQNSNNTNGFMTKSSVIRWFNIFLIPCTYLEVSEYSRFWIYNRKRKKLNQSIWFDKDTNLETRARLNFFWPSMTQKVHDKILINDDDLNGDSPVGGDHMLEFSIVRHMQKPHFQMLVPNDYKTLPDLHIRSVIVSNTFPFIAQEFKLLNIVNEDKRNTHT